MKKASNIDFPTQDYRESLREGAEEEINLRDYIDVIFRRKWLIIGMLFLTFISTLIFSLAQEKLYLASGTIEVNPESQNVTKFEDVVTERLRTEEFVSTQVSLLKSNSIAERVINAINLRSHPVIVGDGEDEKPGLLDGLKGFIKSLIRKDESGDIDTIPIEELMSRKKV